MAHPFEVGGWGRLKRYVPPYPGVEKALEAN